MYKLKLMNEYEFMKIFGCLEVLLALHQGRLSSMYTDSPQCVNYLEYCLNHCALHVFVVINVLIGVN